MISSARGRETLLVPTRLAIVAGVTIVIVTLRCLGRSIYPEIREVEEKKGKDRGSRSRSPAFKTPQTTNLLV